MRKSRFFLLLTLLLLCLPLVSPSLDAAVLNKTEIHDIFSQAKEYFRQANETVREDQELARELYKKAGRRFLRIVNDGGIQNGKLYYNIGNTYFYTDDIGRAILNYRRAEKFIPFDANLKQNLEYALSRRLDHFEEKEETKVLKTLLFWHYDFPLRTRSVTFLVCFAVFWLLATLRLFKSRLIPRWLLGCSLSIALLFFSSVMYEQMIVAQNRAGVILAPEVVARKGDGNNYKPAFKESLHAGTEFKLVEIRENWYQVELLDERRCWLPANDIELI